MLTSCLLVLALQAGAPAPQELPIVSPVVVNFDKTTAAIGEPIVFTFALSEVDAQLWELPPTGTLFAPEQGWLELGRELRGTSIELTLAALEGGGLSVPPLPLVARDGSKELALLRLGDPQSQEAAFLAIDSALAEGEDALRPELGLREIEFGPGNGRFVTSLFVAFACGLLLFAALVFFLVRLSVRKRAGGEAAVQAATGLERLAQLEATTDRAQAQSQAFEATRILRTVIDERRELERSGATDAEWLEGLSDEWATDAQRRELAELFAEAETVKYGGVTQTTFAQEELLVRARRLAREVSSRSQVASPAQSASEQNPVEAA